MAENSIFDIDAEPQGDGYRELLLVGAELCETVGFVLRPQEILLDSATALVNALTPSLTSDDMLSEWPGTRLLGRDDRARVMRFELNERSLATLVESSERLYAWEHPSLPEDLFLERAAHVPWLTSISHERAAFITMTSEEAQLVRSRLPNLALSVRLLGVRGDAGDG